MTLERVNEWGEVQSVFIKDRPPVERVRPLSVGNTAPFFSLTEAADGWQASIFSSGLPGTLTLSDLLDQGPVAVSFYCPCWGSYARPFLNGLISLSAHIQAVGGQLVVFSNENPKYLSRVWSEPQRRGGGHPTDQTTGVPGNISPLTLAYDANYTVAHRFGVYSEYDPIWDRVSGISEDVYIPALYVVGQSRRIKYRFLDENFEGFAQQTEVLNALRS
ncbi:MAG: redoxin domain-containing protein [Bacteroidetes bacterium]|nr:redoxin domain-containing protein [Fibrella sp.]